jgi:hypothetical protein
MLHACHDWDLKRQGRTQVDVELYNGHILHNREVYFDGAGKPFVLLVRSMPENLYPGGRGEGWGCVAQWTHSKGVELTWPMDEVLTRYSSSSQH